MLITLAIVAGAGLIVVYWEELQRDAGK